MAEAVTEKLAEMLKKHAAAPFLFVGSGFSRRYLGLEAWEGLLRRFCEHIKDFGYYQSRANGDLPRAASYMAADFNEWWWKSDETKESRDSFSKEITNESDALKFEISRYLSEKTLEDAKASENGAELAAIPTVNVDGIITTNWDYLLEDLFPDYKVFVGQEELLFSNPQAIGEIYKIHGSASSPKSLILTGEDYQEFSSKNPYLAAKLVTIFVEHPIIFLGYSIADQHVRSIIMSIATCLSQERIVEFQENLFFVQRCAEQEEASIEKATIQSGELSITMTVVKVSDFSDIYAALGAVERKIPARLLRFFKEQMYEFVKNPADQQKKLAVVDMDEIDDVEDVEFVVGLGVAQALDKQTEQWEQRAAAALAEKGYAGVSPEEVFADCIREESKFNGGALLQAAYPIYARSSRKFLPIFRYLRDAGITSMDDLEASKLVGAKKILRKMSGAKWGTSAYRSRYIQAFSEKSTDEIISSASSISEAVEMLAHQPDEDLELNRLRKFLEDNFGAVTAAPHITTFRKLICRYDQLQFGFR